MKRFALAGLVCFFMAGAVAAQTAPKSAELSSSGTSRVILQGLNRRETTVPAPALSYLQGNAGSNQEAPKSPAAEPSKCDGCSQDWADCCCPAACGITVFAEWMYLQPRGADPVYAARALNCFDPPLETHQIDHGASDSIRTGFYKSLGDGCGEIGATFWWFEAQEEDRATPTIGNDVILPLLLHPSQLNCPGTTSTAARASAGIDFDRISIDYKQYTDWNCMQFDWLIGFGYGKLEQDLTAIYDEGSVRADSDLHGYGLRLGGGVSKSHSRRSWISGYVHTDFTLLAANLNARYRSFDVANGRIVNFEQDLDRLVPILDLEAGLAFNVTCHTTIKVGYIYSIWWNVVTNQSFIEDAQQGDISGGIGDTLSFDGLFARVEFVF